MFFAQYRLTNGGEGGYPDLLFSTCIRIWKFPDPYPKCDNTDLHDKGFQMNIKYSEFFHAEIWIPVLSFIKGGRRKKYPTKALSSLKTPVQKYADIHRREVGDFQWGFVKYYIFEFFMLLRLKIGGGAMLLVCFFPFLSATLTVVISSELYR